MAKRRANGEGSIRKRKEGRWEGRYTAGYDSITGKRIIKNVLGKTQAEVKEKMKRAIEENSRIDVTKVGQYTGRVVLAVVRELLQTLRERQHRRILPQLRGASCRAQHRPH